MKAREVKFSIQQKMFLILGGGFFGFLIYFAVNHSVLQASRDTLEKIVEVKLPGIERIDQLTRDVSALRGMMIQALVTQNFDGLGKVDEANKKIVEQFAAWSTEKNLKQVNPETSRKVRDLEVVYAAAYTKLIDIVQNIMVGIASVADSQKNFQAGILELAQVESDLGALKTAFADDLQVTVAEVGSQGQKAIGVGLFLLGIGFVVGIVFYMIMAKINFSLLSVNSGVQGTSKKLLEMVEEARLSSQRLRAAANQQAASSTETVVSMEEMKRILSQTSRSSSEARDLSEASLEEATSGKDLVQALRDAMSEIERSNKDLEEVTAVVKMVRENTEVINEIVFKTQLLSFNANIEAARAGQHGLGFAVVANEIGSLSDMSGKAAEEINELLERSTTKVDKTIAQTKEKIAKANDLSNKCFEFFKQITERSSQLKEMVRSITQATAEQSTGVECVVNAMNELNQSAGETDRMAQGVLMLADGLKGQAMGLASVADRLNQIVRGGDINAASSEESNVYNLPKVDKNQKNLKDSA